MRRSVLEFFAGIGLMRLGLERRGWEVVYANDLDPAKRTMYDAQFGDADEHFQLEDVHAVAADDLPDALLATASFPCTDLSLAGGRKGLRGAQSSAFFGFARALEDLGTRRPPIVLLENVTGFLTSHGGRDFEVAMQTLNDLGYAVDPFVLDAKWFTPQSRPRLFVVASLHSSTASDADETPFRLTSEPSEDRLRPKAVEQFIASHPGIRWARRPLPDPPTACEGTIEDILDDLPDDAPPWWSEERADYLYNQMSPRHKAIADEWIAQRRWSYGTVFRRVRRQPDGVKRSMAELRVDGIAGCLRTPKGGSAKQILFKAGHGRYAARLLTPAECARLMGADGFTINVSDNQALFGFGDAVCASAVAWIAEHYLDPLAEEIAESTMKKGA